MTTQNDYDTMLVKRSLQLSGSGESERSVEVMAEDTTDVLVIILHHSTTSSHTLYFTTQSGTDDVMEIYDKLTETEKARLLFIHAVTGCDTVSGILGQGKPKLLKKLGNAAFVMLHHCQGCLMNS